MNPEKPLHRTPASEKTEIDPFPKPGTKWRPLHRKPHQSDKPISIRRFIALTKAEAAPAEGSNTKK